MASSVGALAENTCVTPQTFGLYSFGARASAARRDWYAAAAAELRCEVREVKATARHAHACTPRFGFRNPCGWLLAALTPVMAGGQIASFKHVIVIVQENRTPDNLFQGLCAPPYGSETSCSTTPAGKQYNIQTANWLDKHSPSGSTQPIPIPLVTAYDLGHTHGAWKAECDMDEKGKCRMDGAGDVGCNPRDVCDATPQPQFRYADYTQNGILNPYLDLATQYGWANYMFHSNQGSSFSAHQFLFGGTSAPSLEQDHAGTFAAENTLSGVDTGCLAAPDIRVQLIDAFGEEDPSNVIYPCFEHATLPDVLKPKGVSWRYYTPGDGGIWTAPNAIDHICQARDGVCQGPDFVANVDLTSSDVLLAIARCKLRQVSWVVPTGGNSDHPRNNNGKGPAWVASIVNALGNSWVNSNHKCDFWGNKSGDATAILILWDDWGGWYDHEAPAILDFPEGGYQYGFRVPFIFVSAYTPRQFVSNGRHDFGSIIRFIEHNFGIAEGALSFADARADTDLSGFFHLDRLPRGFKTIKTPQKAEDFLNEQGPQTAPDDY